MNNTKLIERIRALNIDPNEAMIAKVMELHAESVSDTTIRRAYQFFVAKQKAAAKEAREVAKAAREAAKKAAVAA
jgi:hypothetical protein